MKLHSRTHIPGMLLDLTGVESLQNALGGKSAREQEFAVRASRQFGDRALDANLLLFCQNNSKVLLQTRNSLILRSKFSQTSVLS
jgi:hypothetical protein